MEANKSIFEDVLEEAQYTNHVWHCQFQRKALVKSIFAKGHFIIVEIDSRMRIPVEKNQFSACLYIRPGSRVVQFLLSVLKIYHHLLSICRLSDS